MRIIITGGSGMIGRALVANLAADGHAVIVLSRRPEDRRTRLPASVQVEPWDGKTAAGWGPLADGADAIVNLAGHSIGGEGFPPPRWTPALKQRILHSRIEAGNAVVEAVRAASQKPRMLLQMSGIDYYGPGDNATPFTESSPAGSSFLAGVVVAWEKATEAVEALGVRRVVARTGPVLSMEGGAFPRLLIPFRLFAGGPLGNGRQPFSWIHIEDQVRAMRFLIENEQARGIYNLTAPHPLTNGELAKIVGRVMGRPSFVPAPAFALRLALGEVSTLVLDGQRVLPQRLLEAGFTFQYPDAELAVRALLGRQQ